MNQTAALRGWTERGWRKILLPSGTWLRLRLQSVDHLLRRDIFPSELEAIVLRFALGSFRIADLDPKELRDFLAMKDRLIVESVREILTSDDPDADDAVWEPLDLKPHLAALEIVLPAEDLDELGFVAIRQKAPEAVTAKSRMMLGLTASIEKRREEEEAAGTPAAEFRGVDHDAGGASPGGDGEDIRLPAELGARERHGSSRRARDRSGSLHSPGDNEGEASPDA